MTARYFSSPAAFRAWLARHHGTARELLVGFHKRATGTPSMTWPESVDEALCFGWIDGVRRRVDDTRYTIRFTPRRPRSIWSTKNIARMRELIAEARGDARLAAGDTDRRFRRAPHDQAADPSDREEALVAAARDGPRGIAGLR